MPENKVQTPTDNVLPAIRSEEDMTFRTKKQKIESCVLQLKRKGISKSSAFAICTSAIGGSNKASEADELIKKFAEKDASSFTGITKKGGGVKHTHSYVVMSLNWGETLVGVTTGTNGGKPHVHSINLRLDSKLVAIEAETDYAGIPTEIDGINTIEDNHDHAFKANLDKIRQELPSIYVRSMYFNEDGEAIEGNAEEAIKMARGEGKGVGGSRQGDGGANTCVCTSCGYTMKHDKGVSCAEIKCPSCGGTMKGSNQTMAVIPANKTTDGAGRYFVENERQAEIFLNRICASESVPDWFNGNLEDFQAVAFNSLESQFSDLDLSNNTAIEEVRIALATKKKLDPKAKVRNRGDVVFPAGSKNVKDNKDHFPINSKSQARNALARAAQYKTAPGWYKGSLSSLQKAVRSAVKNKYPSVKVTGLNEFFALRFKEDSDVHFIFLSTMNIQAAKHDASLYFKEAQNAKTDLVKFELSDEGESKFTDLGRITLYDKSSHGIRSSGEIKLTEKDSEGNVIIEMLPSGTFQHEAYGEIVVDDNKLNEIMKNFKDDVLHRDIAFDMNHLPDLPAAAWLKRLSIAKKPWRGGNRNVLMGSVELTKRGEEAIRNKEFKYFSAEYSDQYVDKETGKQYGTVLKGGGLTNRPWMPGLSPIKFSEITRDIGFISKT